MRHHHHAHPIEPAHKLTQMIHRTPLGIPHDASSTTAERITTNHQRNTSNTRPIRRLQRRRSPILDIASRTAYVPLIAPVCSAVFFMATDASPDSIHCPCFTVLKQSATASQKPFDGHRPDDDRKDLHARKIIARLLIHLPGFTKGL